MALKHAITKDELTKISIFTLDHYNQHADSFWEGTRDHDVTQNRAVLLEHMWGKDSFRILDFGCEYVLVTGTHANTPKVINALYSRSGVLRSDAWERLAGSYHGAGCTLAAAIAATLANGLSIEDAVRDAQEYTWQALKQAFRPGMGQYLPDRMFWAREESASDE